MIGSLYTWRGAVWLLLVRAGPPFDRGPRRNVLLERVAPAPIDMLGSPRAFWREGRAWWRTGERVVRPFRGLRRWRP